MRIFHELVVDDYVVGTVTQVSKMHWDVTIGNLDTLRLMVIVDRVSGTTPTLYLAIGETPTVAIHMNNQFQLLGTVPLVVGQPNTYALTVGSGSVVPSSYSFPLLYTLGGSSPAAHIRIWATGRGRA